MSGEKRCAVYMRGNEFLIPNYEYFGAMADTKQVAQSNAKYNCTGVNLVHVCKVIASSCA
jgi:hypothetical protein